MDAVRRVWEHLFPYACKEGRSACGFAIHSALNRAITVPSDGDKDSPGGADERRARPPQNLDAEESVLGAMMLSPGAIAVVSEILSSDGREFYRESHAKIYRAALGLYVKGEPVDAITLADELDERSDLEDVGGKVRVPARP